MNENPIHPPGGNAPWRAVFAAVCVLLLLGGCGRERRYVKPVPGPDEKRLVLLEEPRDRSMRPYVVNGERYYPLPRAEGFVEVGLASWYGEKFHGRPTSSGEIFDMHRESAAHKTLPLGTWVRVQNLENNREMIVRINDRGPFVKGRVIDLSYAAARTLGLVGPGVSQVRIVVLGREVGEVQAGSRMRPVVEARDMTQGDFTVQVGAFQEKANAFRLADRLRVLFDYVDVTDYEDADRGTLYRVRVSRSKTLTQAGDMEKKLEEMGFREAFVVSL